MAEEVQVKDPPVQAEAAKVSEPEVDWKARATEAEARADAHERQVAGLTRTFGDQIAQNNELMQAQGEAVKTGDWTTYDTLVKQINEKAATASLAAANQVVIDKAASAIGKIEKVLGKDFVNDPLFETARAAWRKGDYAEAVVQAAEVRAVLAEEGTAAERKATAKAVLEAKAAAVKETEEKLGKFDMGAGPEAGGSGTLSLADLTKKPTRDMTPKELREHSLALDKAMGFKRR